jgi:hypothetical protein
MSKPWHPRVIEGRRPVSGSAGQWDRRRWPMREAGRPSGLSWRDVGLMLAGGVTLGLGTFLVGGGEVAMPFGGVTVTNPQAVSIVDGDTFHYGGEKIRIADIDTPELRGECPEERLLAVRATTRMSALLSRGPFELKPIFGRDEDVYGRKLRIVTRDGRSLGDQLVAEGLARTWTGRREPWCV